MADKNMVALHGGKIWIDSIFGEGSTFFFHLVSPEAIAHQPENAE
jgi:signal transduction histidine kinase